MQLPIFYLHILPVEIWLACWMLASTRQRRRLSLVCPLFRSICFLSLIERQSADVAALVEGLNRSNWVERIHRLHRVAVRLDRLAGMPLVLAVREWKISSTPPLPQRWTTAMTPGATRAERLARRVVEEYSHIWHIGSFNGMCDRILTTFLATLGLYQNLTCLDIQGMIIDPSLRQTLVSLSRLQDLILDGCDITPPEGIVLNLCRLTICATRQRGTGFRRNASDESASTEGRPEIVYPDRLLEFNLHAAAQSASVIAGFGDVMLSNLGHLSLHALFNADVLLDLLKRCSRLRSLIIPSTSRSSGTPLPQYLPQHVMPLLRTLTVPWDMVGLLTLNRPISAVTVLNQDTNNLVPINDTKDVFIDISRSSTPIRSLVIPCTSSTIETLAFIASMFPTLSELSIDIPEKDENRWASFSCGFQAGEDLHEDTRSPELNDEEAFDNLPAEVLSDSEEHPPPVRRAKPAQTPRAAVSLWADPPTLLNRTSLSTRRMPKEDPPLPAIPSGTYSDFLRRICLDLVEFPPNIALLQIRPPKGASRPSREREAAAIAALSRQYLRLREVTLGPSVWQISSSDSYELLGGSK
ncbi:hypothetical protein B0H13DRAFT_2082640 [Mycena leptocephala]|nr:hypothetical protein B0H13DRAFT_2082640 [Mycena leptocephala]